MMMSPPRPPSPPSGPPMGTRNSRRNEVHPDPPVPASILTITRSTNIDGLRRWWRMPLGDHPCEQRLIAVELLRPDHHLERSESSDHFGHRRSAVQSPVQMRMKLSLLPGCRTRCDDAQLAGAQIKPRTGEHFAVAVGDHPGVERRMQLSDVFPEQLIGFTVNGSARLLSARYPIRTIHQVCRRVRVRRRESGNSAPHTRRVQSSWKAGEQIRLKDHFIDR